MDKAELIRRLMSTFLVELQDHVRVFNRELLALEQDPSGATSQDAIKTLFRTVHSLKGAARSVEAQPLARTCHALEELLAQLRDGSRVVTPELFALMFQAADAFEAAGKQLGSGAPGAAVNASLDALGARLASERSNPAALSRASDSAAAIGSARTAPAEPLAAGRSLAPTPAGPLPAWLGPQALAMPPPPPIPSEAPGRASAIMPPLGAAALERGQARSPSALDAPSILPPTAAGSARLALPTPAPNAHISSAPSARSSAPPGPARSDELAVVRVPVRRLDTLLTQSGELTVARRRLEIRRDEIEVLYESVAHLRAMFRSFYRLHKSEYKSAKQPLPAAGAVNRAAAVRRKPERMLEQIESSLERIEPELERVNRQLDEDVRNLERAATPLEAQVQRVRLLPFAEACEGLQRAVRDLAQSQHKTVELSIAGAELEMDRAIIELARPALLHLVRNAIDHGIEPVEERARLGKPARAAIRVSAALSGERVVISVEDDGRGLDLAALREQAALRGITTVDDHELSGLIFAPGFSTARVVSEVSGRGVGLDAVRALVEGMRGEVEVSSQPQLGARFALQLPVTAGTLRALLVQVGTQVLAIPTHNVRSLVRAGPAEIGRMEGREMLLTATGPLPLASLRAVLHLAGEEPLRADQKLPIVVVGADGRRVALAVDAWQSEQVLLQKALGARVRRLRHVSAAALLPSGEIALLLKAHELVRSVLGESALRSLSKVFVEERVAPKKRVLLVDDSVTTRTLERSILEAAGYEVLVAADGEQGFRMLQDKGADVVVSDVEMPNMDGVALTESVRRLPRFRDLPVVLLTSRDSPADRARGLSAGADAYLVKSSFDQDQLLDTLRQLT